MRALTWQGNEDVRVTDVADPQIQEPTDAIIKVTSTAICAWARPTSGDGSVT
jgi:threonine dehydrogenase-like Zn-dependent dehydrogenase